MSEPIILYLGQIQIALLGIAFMLLVPGALALDRRKVSFEIIDPDEDDKSVHVVGDTVHREVRVKNVSSVTLHVLRAKAFGGAALESAPVEDRRFLPANSSLTTSFKVLLKRSGRWVLQGFDVRVSDPLGLLETRDYLPCVHPFEIYPKRAARRRRGGLSEPCGSTK